MLRRFRLLRLFRLFRLFLGASLAITTLLGLQSSSAEASSASGQRYVVVRGDSLLGIARRFDVSLASIRSANSSVRSTDVVRAGSTLLIPTVPRSVNGLPSSVLLRPERLQLRPTMRHWAKRNSIPADLLEATLYLESGWNQTKVSSTGAIGVGQIMPQTSAYIKAQLIGRQAGGLLLDPKRPEHNIRMSARYLRHLIDANGGDTTKALHSYYQGAGSIAARGLYDDTKQYARAIQALRVRFRTDLTGAKA